MKKNTMRLLVCLTMLVVLTGCSENKCIRYIDYKDEEHIMKDDSWDHYCGMSYGMPYCYDGDLRLSVKEYEYVECEVHYER